MRERYKPFVVTHDFDDVLTHTAVRIVERYNLTYGENVDVKYFYSPVTLETWGTDDLLLVQSRIERIAIAIDNEPHVVDPEAVWGVRALAERGIEQHVVTGRDETRYKVTKRILNDYFAGYFDSLTFTNQFVAPDRPVERLTKGVVSAGLRADLHNDDHVQHGYDVLTAGVKNAVIFGRHPWNEQHEERRGLSRCDNWKQLIDKVDALAAS